MRKIPATMASQHPDHAGKPYWHKEEFIKAQDEHLECFLSFSELGMSEYKWDWEGKLVDESVIERLYGEYFEYFKKNPLGSEKFLTFRLPNPKVETEFRIGRAFMLILGAASLTKKFHLPIPLFEVILPMTETAQELIDIQEAFLEMHHLKHNIYRLYDSPLRHIQMIPLFEQVDVIMNSSAILEKYIQLHKKKFKFYPEYIRPYVARSDPALNSGMVPTVLAIKIALSHYKDFEKKYSIPLFPIIGSASLPFRGGLTPTTVLSFIEEYHGIKTALLQSAFRYDYKKEEVIKAIKVLEKKLQEHPARSISASDEKQLRNSIPAFEKEYRKTIEKIAPIINSIASMLPKRRERVQHTGLFGYSRGVGNVKLPRAIGFTAALYSIGIPPEIIGTGRGLQIAKEQNTAKLIESVYINFKKDIERAGKYLNKKNLLKLKKTNPAFSNIEKDIHFLEHYFEITLGPETEEEKEHEKITSKIIAGIDLGKNVQKLIMKAAIIRKSLG